VRTADDPRAAADAVTVEVRGRAQRVAPHACGDAAARGRRHGVIEPVGREEALRLEAAEALDEVPEHEARVE
jgi:hypothetical protein